jgi:hypothetical protein
MLLENARYIRNRPIGVGLGVQANRIARHSRIAGRLAEFVACGSVGRGVDVGVHRE